MYPILIPLLTFIAVLSIGGAVLSVRANRRVAMQERLASGQAQSLTPRSSQSSVVGALAQLGQAAGPKEASPVLKAKLAQAGYHAKHAAAVYLGTKFLLFALGIIGSGLLVWPMERFDASVKLLIIAWCAMVLFMLPNLLVERQRQLRKREIQDHLPNMLDMLEICVSAGMGLDLAWNAVADEMRDVSTVLADEMALTDFEIHLNAPRAVAMRHMAERTGADEIGSLAAVLVQSDRFGTSIGEALRTYAGSMREERSRRAEERAEKMVVKLLFPMVLLIFPAVGVVICGPAVLRWAALISGS